MRFRVDRKPASRGTAMTMTGKPARSEGRQGFRARRTLRTVTLTVIVAAGLGLPAQFAGATHDLTLHKELLQPTDTTPPLITPALNPTANAAGWNRSDVMVSWTVIDLESGIASSTGCETTTLTDETAGTVLTCEARNGSGSVVPCLLCFLPPGPGLVSSEPVTIRIDKTAPAVVYSSNADVYAIDETIAITCATSDALSGVVSDTCADISGAAYGFSLGANTYGASATDTAGNVGAGSVTFTVEATPHSLSSLVEQFVSEAGAAEGMTSKLDAAAAASANGNEQAKRGALNAFRNQVEAKRGKTLTDAQADLLIQLSMQL